MATNIKKRLYEEKGMLCGEVTMDFTNLEAARLYQFDKKSPLIFSICNTIDGEAYESSNGTLGSADYMNVVFWKTGAKKLEVTTSVSAADDANISLIGEYRAWRK